MMETVIGFASCPHVHSFKTLIFCTGGVKHQRQNVIGLPTLEILFEESSSVKLWVALPL